MRLTWKINLALVVAMAAILVVQARGRLQREIAMFETEIRRDHAAMGRTIRHAVEDELDDSGPDAARALVTRLDAREEGIRIRYVEVGAAEPALRPEVPADALRELGEAGQVVVVDRDPRPGWFYTYVALDMPGPRQSALEIRESLAAQDQYVASTRWRAVQWLAAIVGTLWLTVALLVRWLVGRPVDQLIEHGRRVAAGDFGSRVHSHRADELGVLARELDRMAERLARARDRLAAEQAARERAVDQLRHADRLMSIGKLAAGVAHELGTPLNIALVRARSIADGDPPDADAARVQARRIAEQCERMSAIIRQLLDFARPRTMETGTHDLRGLATTTVALLAPVARNRDVAIEVVAGPPVRARVDPSQIQQVLLNLLSNALHATSPGGRVTIEADLASAAPPPGVPARGDRWARLTVRDTGAGILPEHQPHVFEPFFTTKDVGEGTGLGLSVSHGIVRDHGGWIGLDSTPGEGTRVSVHLPPSEPCADAS